MQKTQPQPIRDILKTTLGEMVAGKDSLSKEDINEAWEKAAGKAAGNHSSPARIRGKVLIVNVDSPIWIYQLNLKRAEIEKKLNRLIGRKAPLSIRLRAGED